jgi:elongation factor Ts
MAEITMDLIKQLRNKTSVGMMDCKNALIESDGDFDKAIEILRKKGAAVAAKRADNTTDHGVISAYVSADYSVGSLLETSCETDFAANTDYLKDFTTHLVKKIADNKEVVALDALLQQKLGNGALTVGESLEEVVSKISENTKIGRMACYATGTNGLVQSYIHPGATLGILIELEASNDISAHKEEISAAARNICMQIAVTNPLCVRPAELDPALVEKERAFIVEQLAASGKPAAMVEKITAGKLDKFYEEVCLLQQKYIKDDKLKVSDVCDQLGKTIGATITVKRFARYAVGK